MSKPVLKINSASRGSLFSGPVLKINQYLQNWSWKKGPENKLCQKRDSLLNNDSAKGVLKSYVKMDFTLGKNSQRQE